MCHICSCFTVTHHHLIDLLSRSPFTLVVERHRSGISYYQTHRPENETLTGIYPCSSSIKTHVLQATSSFTADRFSQTTISVPHVAKLTALGLWVSILRSSLSLCSALLLSLFTRNLMYHPHSSLFLSVSLSFFPCRRNWCWHFTPRPLLRVNTYGSAGWRTRPFTSASTHTHTHTYTHSRKYLWNLWSCSWTQRGHSQFTWSTVNPPRRLK